MVDLRAPLTEDERRSVEAAIVRLSGGWEREGEQIPPDWEQRTIAAIGQPLWQRRVATHRSGLDPRIGQMTEDGPAPAGASGRPESSADWHRTLANPGPEDLQRFLAERVAPVYREDPPPRRHRAAARRLLELHRLGHIGLHETAGWSAVRGQVEEIAGHGWVSASTREGTRRLIPPVWLLETLITLAEASQPPERFGELSPQRQHSRVPFYVLSLVRLRGNPGSLHFLGRGIDITRYNGYQINMRDPAAAFEGVIGVIRSLPRGRYRLGLPRVPSEGPFDRCVSATGPHDQTGRWRVGRTGRYFSASCGDLRERTNDFAQFPYFYDPARPGEPVFRAPYRGASPRHPWGQENPFLDRRLMEGHSPGGVARDLRRFEVPEYARRMEAAIARAEQTHRAEIDDLFPDKPNHLHLGLIP